MSSVMSMLLRPRTGALRKNAHSKMELHLIRHPVIRLAVCK